MGLAERSTLTAQISGEIMAQMRDSGFTAQLAVELDNRHKEPETFNEIISQVLSCARYRLQKVPRL